LEQQPAEQSVLLQVESLVELPDMKQLKQSIHNQVMNKTAIIRLEPEQARSAAQLEVQL
jgi:hypothetical protein